MASMIRCATSSASAIVDFRAPSNSHQGLANSSSRSSVFGKSLSPQLRSSGPRCFRASPPSLIPVAVRVHNLRVEKLNGSRPADNVPPMENDDVSFWDNFKSHAENLFAAGFTPEVVMGRTAMLGFLSATTVEFETGKSVLQQLTFRGDIFAVVVAVGVLLMSMGRKDEDGSDVLSRPSGVFTPTAERLNGQAAMLGFTLLVAIESAKGSALF